MVTTGVIDHYERHATQDAGANSPGKQAALSAWPTESRLSQASSHRIWGSLRHWSREVQRRFETCLPAQSINTNHCQYHRPRGSKLACEGRDSRLPNLLQVQKLTSSR